jgi:hypothetical protein
MNNAKTFPRTILEKGECADMENETALQDQTVQATMLLPVYGRAKRMKFWVKDAQKLKAWSPRVIMVESMPFFGEAKKERRFKLSSKVYIRMGEALKMGQLISVQWEAQHA